MESRLIDVEKYFSTFKVVLCVPKYCCNKKKFKLLCLKCFFLQILCDSQDLSDGTELLSLSLLKQVLHQHLPEPQVLGLLKHCYFFLIFVIRFTVNIKAFLLYFF